MDKIFLLKRLKEEEIQLRDYLLAGNARWACEKIYVIVSTAIKILAEHKGLPEYEEAKKNKFWSVYYLNKAAYRLSHDPIYKIDETIEDMWAIAWKLHSQGFEQNYITIKEARKFSYIASKMLNILENNLQKSG
uniref:HEPN domain-containing protein n=1 Tax=candidate division WOR-3 bacterium TaxID=2052148 RepID=A0A7C2K613_UNCW3